MNAPNQLSFLPEDYLENKAQRRANVICAVLFLVTMVSIGLAFTTSERSLKEVEQKHAKIEQEFTDAAKRIEQVQQMQDKQRTMAHQAELTASLLEKVPRSLILAKITNSLPAGCSLTDFVLLSTTKRNSAANTPGAFRDSTASILRTRAWAWTERTMTACVWPGRLTSSWKRPSPRTRRASSNRLIDWPIPNCPMGR